MWNLKMKKGWCPLFEVLGADWCRIESKFSSTLISIKNFVKWILQRFSTLNTQKALHLGKDGSVECQLALNGDWSSTNHVTLPNSWRQCHVTSFFFWLITISPRPQVGRRPLVAEVAAIKLKWLPQLALDVGPGRTRCFFALSFPSTPLVCECECISPWCKGIHREMNPWH